MAADPAITITVNVDSGSYYSLTVRAHHTADPLELPYCDSTSNLRALREELGERLEDMKNATRGELDLRKFPDLMDAAMSRLHETGYDLLPRMLGAQTTMLGKLRQYCATAISCWRDSEHPFVIEVRGHPDVFLPLECLPLFGSQKLPLVRDLHALKVEADAYAGFRAVVHRRQIPEVRPGHDVRPQRPEKLPVRLFRTLIRRQIAGNGAELLHRNAGRLPVKFFYRADLDGAQKEKDFFTGLSDVGQIELEGPWPIDASQLDDPTRVLSDHLNQPLLSFVTGKSRELPDQVQHFACHCEIHALSRDRPWDVPRVGLAADVWIRLVDLRVDWNERYSYLSQKKLPLIFMNACATSRIDAAQTGSFAKHFLDHGHLGFIGTEAAIPDMVAAEFSAGFYSRLLAGDSLGVALLDARRQLKDCYGNPLGLLYTMYADPRISIEGAPA